MVLANGVELSIVEEGSGPLVILLHGFPDTPNTWDAVRPALAKAGFRAVSPFMRGYAPSGIPADGRYDAGTLGRDVLGLIEALGQKDAIVIGHDWGAAAAYAAAAIGPERVRHLVTIGIPHPASLQLSLRLLSVAWGARHFASFRLPGAAGRLRANDFALVDHLVQRWSPSWTVPPEETRAVKAALSPPGHAEAALGYYRATRPTLPVEMRSKIQVPTTAFSGEHDGILVRDDYERARPRFTGRYDVVHMPGGHFMHREHPEHFIRELLNVLPRETPTA